MSINKTTDEYKCTTCGDHVPAKAPCPDCNGDEMNEELNELRKRAGLPESIDTIGGEGYPLDELSMPTMDAPIGSDPSQIGDAHPTFELPEKTATFTQVHRSGKDSVTVSATADDMDGIHELMKLAGMEKEHAEMTSIEAEPECDTCGDDTEISLDLGTDSRQGPPSQDPVKAQILASIKDKMARKFQG